MPSATQDFVGATVMLVYGVEESRTLTEELKEVFFRMIYAMDYDPVANAVLKQVQEYVSKRITASSLSIGYTLASTRKGLASASLGWPTDREKPISNMANPKLNFYYASFPFPFRPFRLSAAARTAPRTISTR